jgi:hypothetical protein
MNKKSFGLVGRIGIYKSQEGTKKVMRENKGN